MASWLLASHGSPGREGLFSVPDTSREGRPSLETGGPEFKSLWSTYQRCDPRQLGLARLLGTVTAARGWRGSTRNLDTD